MRVIRNNKTGKLIATEKDDPRGIIAGLVSAIEKAGGEPYDTWTIGYLTLSNEELLDGKPEIRDVSVGEAAQL